MRSMVSKAGLVMGLCFGGRRTGLRLCIGFYKYKIRFCVIIIIGV